MITSKDILAKTGLKSAKTLTRWHQRGLIPEPLVSTHPSGRGKLAYWPDWVLNRCLRIVALQREGHSLDSVAKMLTLERWHENLERLDAERPVSELLEGYQVDLSPTHEGTVLDAFLLAMVASVKAHVTDIDERRSLLAKLTENHLVDHALQLARAGYNPLLVYDGDQPEVIPDFLVAQHFSADHPEMTARVVAPLLPNFRKLFPRLEQFVGTPPVAWPAPKIWVQEGDAVVEYTYYPAGAIGFELIRATAKVVSKRDDEAECDAEATRDIDHDERA